MSLPLTVPCFSKIQIGVAFLVPAHPGSPGQKAVKWVCVCSFRVTFGLVWFSRISRLGLALRVGLVKTKVKVGMLLLEY